MTFLTFSPIRQRDLGLLWLGFEKDHHKTLSQTTVSNKSAVQVCADTKH